MQIKRFYFVQNNDHAGPYNEQELLSFLEQKEIPWNQYIFDGSSQDWLMLLEIPFFAEKFNAGWGDPEATPLVMETPAFHSKGRQLRHKEWNILRGENSYGPYSFPEVIQMLQEKTLFEYDFIWHQKHIQWKRVAEVSDFSPENIKQLIHSGETSVADIFYRRRHARAQYGCSLIVHDNKSVFKGQSVEISAGGAGIVIPTQTLQPGQNIFLHFQSGDGVPPFNAICSIVSKQFVRTSPGEPQSIVEVKYGVKFTSISQNVRESIKTFAENVAGPRAA